MEMELEREGRQREGSPAEALSTFWIPLELERPNKSRINNTSRQQDTRTRERTPVYRQASRAQSNTPVSTTSSSDSVSCTRVRIDIISLVGSYVTVAQKLSKPINVIEPPGLIRYRLQWGKLHRNHRP